MKVSYNWLKDYVTFDLPPEQLAEILTMAGFEVEDVISTVPDFNGIIVGKVISTEKHPNADKLTVCRVETGNENLQIICGAANVAAGQLIPFAPVGTKLPNGLKISKSKIRGIDSYGMICSQEELGFDEKSDGIWVLPPDWKIGEDVHKKLDPKTDFILDINITPNRPDAMCMIGIAREVANLLDSELKIPKIDIAEKDATFSTKFLVEIKNPEGCPRYSARIIENISPGTSPEWLQERLNAAGIRPINNIVDITNYVLMETGQPLHAFDLEKLTGNKIVVRDSYHDEIFVTLDNKERKLSDETIMICDGEKPVAIGGIMGGLNSEISETTKHVLLESAYFTPSRIARSCRKLGLSSEASLRFERGVDPNGIIYSSDRAAAFIAELAGGNVVTGLIDSYPKEIIPVKVPVRVSRINHVLGTNVSEKTVTEIFNNLGINYVNGKATIPTFRPDLEREIDLVEEVARVIGFDAIPVKERVPVEYHVTMNENERFINTVKIILQELGFNEIITNSMIPSRDLKGLDDADLVEILNPISDDMNRMRPSLIPGLLKTAAYNINRNIADFRLFEVGRSFRKLKKTGEYFQPYYVAGLIHGKPEKNSWEMVRPDLNFFDIKGLIETFLNKIFLDKEEFILYDIHVYFDNNQGLAVRINEDVVGHFGLIKTSVVERFDISTPVFAFEFLIEALAANSQKRKKYKPFSRFPYIETDLAFVVGENILAGDMRKEIIESGGNLLNYAEVFDLFRNEQLGHNKKSIAFRLRFLSYERTLNDPDVEEIVKKIIKNIEFKFQAKLRA